MKNHFEKIHSRGTNQHCDRCSKPNIFGVDVQKHIDSHQVRHIMFESRAHPLIPANLLKSLKVSLSNSILIFLTPLNDMI